MRIRQFRYGADNLGYLICGTSSAMAIDGGAVDQIMEFLQEEGIGLRYVLNTHSHMDHTSGNQALLNRSQALFIDIETLIRKKVLKLDGEEIRVFHTPGHTRDSISFLSGEVLISGDTLFQGKVGRCFSGDLKAFLESIKTIMGFPDETVVYAGHDYVEEYMEFVRALEPDNPYVDEYLRRYDSSHVFSTLADEYRVNPFLRFNQDKIISILRKKGLPAGTEYERWQSIMSMI